MQTGISMEEYYEIIRKSILFQPVDNEALGHVLQCLEGRIESFHKGETILQYGDRVYFAGMVLEGKAEIIVPEENGEDSAIWTLPPSEMFGCEQSCSFGARASYIVTARKRTKVLFLKLSKLLQPEAAKCRYASAVTANLLRKIAADNIRQKNRIHIMSQKSIRLKLIAYLDQTETDPDQANMHLNRHELAGYLGVERSALSREMSRMKKEGLIDYGKDTITLRSKTGKPCGDVDGKTA